MEPIPESSQAVEDYGPFATREGDLLDELRESADRVRALVPECIGLSLALEDDGVSFTLVATDEEMAALDALQYAVGGPCVEAVKAERVLAYTHEQLLEEDGWQLFAQATAAASIASTLTLPVVVAGRVAGSVNLYATSRGAFTGRHEQIAEIFDAWAPGAVANADLDFSTRAVAERAPRVLGDQIRIQVALGILMKDQDIDVGTARALLNDSAQRAGAAVLVVAEQIISEATYWDRSSDQ